MVDARSHDSLGACAAGAVNPRYHRAVSDLTGKTGMSIVRAIVAGERRPERLAELRDRRCKKSVETITEYLTGNWRDDHLFNLASALALYDAVEQQIASYESRLQEMFVALQPPERRDLATAKHPCKLAQLVYRMLRYGTSYVDVGAAAYEERFRSRQLHGLRSSANSLGYDLVPHAVTPD